MASKLSTQLTDIISLLSTTTITTTTQSVTDAADTADGADTTGGYDGRIKCPKGTRDYGPGDMRIRELMMRTIKANFAKYGGQFMETPVFELRDLLMDKYGEDEKLIYDLAKQEAEPLCLRYDLTVPLARYIAMNRRIIKSPFKAARVGRVYRRDQPYMSKGRLREFWQCDFDIVRTAVPVNALDLVLDDVEVVALLTQQLIQLIGANQFVVMINHRKLLDAALTLCNVPPEKVKTISAAIDKLDKNGYDLVKKEIMDKGIDNKSAKMILRITECKGPLAETLDSLKADQYTQAAMKTNPKWAEAFQELELLITFLQAYSPSLLPYLLLDMSMVRGLDYYTGIIMEGQFADASIAAQYGSIAGGGRYDELVTGLAKSSGELCPCVGASLGFERIFSYLKNTQGVDAGVSTDVLVCELGTKDESGDSMGFYEQRLKLLAELRQNEWMGAEIMNKISPSFRDQIGFAEQREIKWMVIMGEDELKSDTVNLRRLMLKGDTVLDGDGKKCKILDIVTDEKSKWPKFKVERDGGKKGKKEVMLTKKQIKKVVENDIEFEFQIKGLARSELVDFFRRIYDR